VIASIPGYGFSGPTTEPGWNVERIARAWAELMSRLGYDRYGAHGGDWGAIISRELGRIDADHVTGVHVTMVPATPSSDPAVLDKLTDSEKERLGDQSSTPASCRVREDPGPHALAFGLHDSPVSSSPGSWTCSSCGPTPRTCRKTRSSATRC
jgi:epoxide hydrolase